jgi:CheY-like chemotaxis protein
MSGLHSKDQEILFPARGLPSLFSEHIRDGRTGYWEYRFDRLNSTSSNHSWSMAVSSGKILYTGNRDWSSASLSRLVWRHIPLTRNKLVKEEFNAIRKESIEKSWSASKTLEIMIESTIITEQTFISALEAKILSDLDVYLLMGSGSTIFTESNNLSVELPVIGFNPIDILKESKGRQSQWTSIKSQVPSMALHPILNKIGLEAAEMSPAQKRKIEILVNSGGTLCDIAETLAEDYLSIGAMFAKLIKDKIIQLEPPQKNKKIKIMIIDDSPLLLTQFEKWTSILGYTTIVCQNATKAIKQINEHVPSVIFIDINMPVVSGFELVKLIRQEPGINKIPLVILTGEERLSNKWRAKWSQCDFLTKPLSPGKIIDFQEQLKKLLLMILQEST